MVFINQEARCDKGCHDVTKIDILYTSTCERAKGDPSNWLSILIPDAMGWARACL
jgi:hypothetical protein